MRVLLVDDHPLFIDGLNNLLTSRGIEVVGRARDGLEALQQARALSPDLIFMDIHLPDENGLELTKRIKSQYPHIKIVILTVYDFPEYREAAQRCGVEDFVIKGLTSWKEIVVLVKSISSKIGKPI